MGGCVGVVAAAEVGFEGLRTALWGLTWAGVGGTDGLTG